MKYLVFSVLLLLTVSCQFEQCPGCVWIVSCGMDYANSPVNTLEGTVDDALEVCMCLTDIYSALGMEYRSICLISKGPDSDMNSDSYPSAKNIERTLSEIDPGEDDLLIFFFSGHGDTDEHGPCLVCGKTEEEPKYSSFYLDDLFSVLENKNCPCAVIVDSCYSGSMSEMGDEENSGLFLKVFGEKPFSDVSVISSCQKGKKSAEIIISTMEGTEERHGLFTFELLNSLGWVHSISEIRSITAGDKQCAVRGYLEKIPDLHSLSGLYSQIMLGWDSSFQKPSENNNVIGVNLIP